VKAAYNQVGETEKNGSASFVGCCDGYLGLAWAPLLRKRAEHHTADLTVFNMLLLIMIFRTEG